MSTSGFSTRLVALTRKETRQMLRDRSNLVVVLLLPVLLILLFGYGLSFDVTDARVTVVLEDSSPTARDAVAGLQGSPYLAPSWTTSMAEAERLIRAGQTDAILRVPGDFSRRLAAGAGHVQLLLNGVDSNTASSIDGYVSGALAIPAQQQIDRSGNKPAAAASVTIVQRMTPLTPLQILVGKALPSMLVGLLQSTIIFLIILLWFRIPMSGSVWLLYLGLLTFTLASVGIGLSISAVSLTMQQAMLYTFMLVMPLMLLSGLLTPVRNMPDILQLATYANPLRFGVDLVRRVYLEGAEFSDVAFDFVPLLVMAAITLPLSAWLFRNRLS